MEILNKKKSKSKSIDNRIITLRSQIDALFHQTTLNL